MKFLEFHRGQYNLKSVKFIRLRQERRFSGEGVQGYVEQAKTS